MTSIAEKQTGGLRKNGRLPYVPPSSCRAAVSCFVWLLLCGPSATSQNPGPQETPNSLPDTTTIVEQMQRHEQHQSNALQSYEGLRHYSVTYRGFAKTITASMDVEVEYNASSGKSFESFLNRAPVRFVKRC